MSSDVTVTPVVTGDVGVKPTSATGCSGVAPVGGSADVSAAAGQSADSQPVAQLGLAS